MTRPETPTRETVFFGYPCARPKSEGRVTGIHRDNHKGRFFILIGKTKKMNDSIESRIRQAETRWPQLRFKRKGSTEASAPCPFCAQGVDRFLIFDNGGYWCRVCDTKGWLDEKDTEWGKLDPTERRLRILEAEQRRARIQREEQTRRLSALEKMARCTDHLIYHHNLAEKDLDNRALDYWLSEGVTIDSIAEYKLGLCPRCPTDRTGRPSYTIPVFGRDGTTLINIRHRLVDAPDGDKYRPHRAGLGAQLFNARFTNGRYQRNQILIVEGEKKSIVAGQYGLQSVAVMGKKGSFRRKWAEWLKPFSLIYVALDPDALDSAYRLAAGLGRRARVVNLPVKVDDFFVKYGGSENDIQGYLETARPAGNRNY